MINFIYFGRLTYDKGIDIVLDACSAIAKNYPDLPWHIHIYGSGPYMSQCIDIAKQNTHVSYHGRAPLSLIQEKLQTIHYCLAPSRVVETFGKSALEALQYGLPIIGFQKGGLAQFITDAYALETNDGLQSMIAIIEKAITAYAKNGTVPERGKEQSRVAHYTKEQRIHTIQLGQNTRPQTIFAISDFTNSIGGIETFLHESATVLKQYSHQIFLYGTKNKVSSRGFVATICNIKAWFFTRLYIRQHNPSIIRYHSLFRRLGWCAIVPRKSNRKQRITIHDLGYFHPYPSRLYDENAISSFTRKSRIQEGKTWREKCFIIGKFFSLWLLKKQCMRCIDCRYVPSPFIKPILEKYRDVPGEKIIIHPHFGSTHD